MKRYVVRTERAVNVLSKLTNPSLGGDVLATIFDTFTSRLLYALKTCSVEPVLVEALTFETLEKAKVNMLRPGTNYICFDSQSKLGIPFGVSRCFDPKTGLRLGITSRPGWDELDEQTALLKRLHGSKFGIIEDDIFTGGTLRHMIERFAQSDITITDIVCGISAAAAVSGVPVQAAVYYEQSELLEITDPRDYLYGAQDGGLVVSDNGRKLRVPYDAGFMDLSARSSISKSKVTTFSRIMRQANYDVHESLGSLDYPANAFYPAELLREAGYKRNCTFRAMLEREQ